MGKLYFNYSTMNAGKSTALLQAAYNYEERGMAVLLLTAACDDRSRRGRIASRVGLARNAETFDASTDLYERVRTARGDEDADNTVSCVLVDEAQFLTKTQVWQLARAVDDVGVPVLCYGLRVDFRGELFPGSAALLAWADELREVRTVCFCGKKATMVVRRGADGNPLTHGDQVGIGGEEQYVSLCRRHFRAATSKNDDGKSEAVRFVESALGAPALPPGRALPAKIREPPPPPLMTVTPIKARAASPAGPAQRAGPVAGVFSGLRPAPRVFCIGGLGAGPPRSS